MTPESIIAALMPDLFADANLATYIALAEQQLSEDVFGDDYALAVAYLAAHMWYLSSVRNGEAGVITYKSAGRMMQSNGGVGVIRSALELSNYGMQLKELIYKHATGATTTALNLIVGGLLS